MFWKRKIVQFGERVVPFTDNHANKIAYNEHQIECLERRLDDAYKAIKALARHAGVEFKKVPDVTVAPKGEGRSMDKTTDLNLEV